MKKQLPLLFVLMLLPAVMNADPVEINGIYYNLITEEKVAEVTYNPNYYSGNVEIPATLEYENVTYSVTSIGEMAFCGCSSLTSITIPNSVTSIGMQAFSGCSLTSITIPRSVTNIAAGALEDCPSITSIYVEAGNAKYDSRNNCNGIIETETNTLVSGCQNTIIPNSVISIGDRTFLRCSNLASITIPNSVTSIGDYAFSGCSGLTSISIPNSVTSIANGAFSGCSGLTSVNVEVGNTKYDSHNNCNAIVETESNTLIVGCQNTIIPNSVTSIGEYAFYGCSGLISVTIPNSVISIGALAFYSCRGLTSITIGNSVTSIGASAFNSCYELTSITIGNSITNIGNYAFACTGLTSITIPNSVTSIGDGAFYGCSGLTSVTVESSVPVSINAYTFFNRQNATLFVPKGSKAAYEAAHYWKEFKEIVEIGTPDDINAVDVSEYFDVYTLNGIRLRSKVTTLKGLPAGAYIVNGRKTVIK